MSDLSEEGPGQYISALQHEENLSCQLATSPELVDQFRGYGISEDKTCKLEYFFYTNTSEKAAALSSELSEMGYHADVESSGPDTKIRIVAGATVPVLMATEKVLEWTELMCTVGYKHDCEFDGWGLNPEQ